jgi:hypothetical protein
LSLDYTGQDVRKFLNQPQAGRAVHALQVELNAGFLDADARVSRQKVRIVEVGKPALHGTCRRTYPVAFQIV